MVSYWKICDMCTHKILYVIQQTYKENPVCWGLGYMLEIQSRITLLHARSVTSVVSDRLWPYWLKPTRFLCPWDSQGKNAGVGCHALLWGYSSPRHQTWVSGIGGWNLNGWDTKEDQINHMPKLFTSTLFLKAKDLKVIKNDHPQGCVE